MIYRDIIAKKVEIVRPLVCNLIEKALQNQTHDSDFLLLLTNGHYDEFFLQYNKSPYAIGGDVDYTAAQSFSKYIKWYVESETFAMPNKIEINYPDPGLEKLKISVHNEKGIYLRYWEADLTLRLLYQISRLCNSKAYDWHWRAKLDAQRSRINFLKNDIIEALANVNPAMTEFLNNTIIRQIRNAIAHSQYCLLNNDIKYLNYSKDAKKKAGLMLLKYNEWEDIIHNTVVFNSEMTRALNLVYDNYKPIVKQNNGILQVRVQLMKINIVIIPLAFRLLWVNKLDDFYPKLNSGDNNLIINNLCIYRGIYTFHPPKILKH